MEIHINYKNNKSIIKAEEKKALAENKGLTLIKTITLDTDNYILIYK